MDEKLKQLVADVFDIPTIQVTPGLKAENLESWDSMAHLQLVISLENEYEISIMPEEATTMNSLQEVIELLEVKKES